MPNVVRDDLQSVVVYPFAVDCAHRRVTMAHDEVYGYHIPRAVRNRSEHVPQSGKPQLLTMDAYGLHGVYRRFCYRIRLATA